MSDAMQNTTVQYIARESLLLLRWKKLQEIPRWASQLLFLVLFTAGIIANTFLIIYLLRSRKYRVAIFTLLINLAICDWFLCLSVQMVTLITPDMAFHSYSRAFAKFLPYIGGVSYDASTYHLVFLAALRFYQLAFPLPAKVRVTSSWVLRRCIFIWLCCLIASIPRPVYFTAIPVSYNNNTLNIAEFVGNGVIKEMAIVVFTQILPLVIIAVLHILKICRVARDSMPGNSEKRITDVSNTVALILLAFVLSLLPRLLHSCYHIILGQPFQTFHTAFFYFSAYVSYSNSIINPFLYVLKSPEIRNDILLLFCRRGGT